MAAAAPRDAIDPIDAQLIAYIKACVLAHYSNPSLNVFDLFMEKCALYYDRPAHSISEIKDKLNTRFRGDIFEHFCALYLKATDPSITDLWLLRDLPDDLLAKLKLKRNDLGIDLIGRNANGQFCAIQAKYRKRTNTYRAAVVVGWRELSTFYALVSRSGPYYRHYIISNADYHRHVGKKEKKDRSICYKTLRNTPIDVWNAMAPFNSNVVGVSVAAPVLVDAAAGTAPHAVQPSIEELRALRLKYLTKAAEPKHV